ncbi:DUF2147 domain-containing protein [Phenylobacterium hankyongense]|uniref:DUF2147 domain-containing protein n=1 Tax=Phenylobacterium hankyongense TaxID=1813876 RepID=A0A328B2T0_9CAUL|nr:DUF2147 domain-containing protein [Phenylobacterium hankyongense]RAK60144.1 DUF2147 domain-containing protein [Phenylobacterium hankyongense]
MRPLFFAAALSLAASPALAADPVEGDWLTPGGSAKVHIAPCAGQAAKLCGQIVWLKAPKDAAGAPKRDENNPDAGLQSRPIVGLPLIRDFRRVEMGRWIGGKVYDPQSGKTYDSKMSMNPDGTLKLEGCMMIICRAQTWKRPT